MILIDTSVWIEAERNRIQAQTRLAELLESGEGAVSVVTVFELLRSPTLPAEWRAFYADLFSVLPVIEVGADAAEAAALTWGTRAADASKDAADALIAGTALAAGLGLLTCDSGQAALLPTAELLRPS
jgi:predicted nucleic acid-binding protein